MKTLRSIIGWFQEPVAKVSIRAFVGGFLEGMAIFVIALFLMLTLILLLDKRYEVKHQEAYTRGGISIGK